MRENTARVWGEWQSARGEETEEEKAGGNADGHVPVTKYVSRGKTEGEEREPVRSAAVCPRGPGRTGMSGESCKWVAVEDVMLNSFSDSPTKGSVKPGVLPNTRAHVDSFRGLSIQVKTE